MFIESLESRRLLSSSLGNFIDSITGVFQDPTIQADRKAVGDQLTR